VVLELAASLGISVKEEPIGASETEKAHEFFLAGTTADIMPIVRVDDRPIGSGSPGAITMRLYKEFRAYMDESVTADRGVASARG
jgi:branched-subunit amino acid aminotransferase/4-amino-4-deoxychorismate lyase